MITGSRIYGHKDDSHRAMKGGNFFSFEHFSTFPPILFVSSLQFRDKIKANEVYQSCLRIKRRLSLI